MDTAWCAENDCSGGWILRSEIFVITIVDRGR